MTSNQINYWKNEELKRANRVDEQERERANKAIEKLRNSENWLKFQDLYQKYGAISFETLPEDVQQQILDSLGSWTSAEEFNSMDGDRGVGFVWQTIKDVWNTILGGKGIGSLGSLF